MLCAPLDWKYAELPSSASDALLCTMLVCRTSNEITSLPFHYGYLEQHVNEISVEAQFSLNYVSGGDT